MNFSTTTVAPKVFIVKVDSPRATVEVANAFKNELLDHINHGQQKGVVDLTETDFIDSAFLGALVTGLKRATAKNGDIRIVGLKEPVMAMFEITRLNRIFDIYQTTEQALDSF